MRDAGAIHIGRKTKRLKVIRGAGEWRRESKVNRDTRDRRAAAGHVLCTVREDAKPGKAAESRTLPNGRDVGRRVFDRFSRRRAIMASAGDAGAERGPGW